MNAFALERTVEVMPLGRRGRYSLTPNLQRIYIMLVKLTDAAGGVTPTQHELAAALGKPVGGYLTEALEELTERGWLHVIPFVPRGIRLLDPVLRDLKAVPHEGSIR